MSKHTPGPWRKHDMEDATVVAGMPGTSWTIAACDNRHIKADECKSNAALIAAAPLAYSEFEQLIGIATDKSAPMGERLAYIETRCKIMLEKMRGES